MLQWLVTLRAQIQPGVDEPRIVIKVEMSDECYYQHHSSERIQLVKSSSQRNCFCCQA
jgi:hypothetical protein